jgi:hypothetical protein
MVLFQEREMETNEGVKLKKHNPKSLLSCKSKNLSATQKRESCLFWSTVLYPCLRQAGATRKILCRACPDENREDSVFSNLSSTLN